MKVIQISASAGITGFESPAAAYAQTGCSLDELLVENPSATFIGKACGESMIDLGIHSGDVLIVDRHIEARNLDIIVACINGEFVCKQLDIKNRMLLSANSRVNMKPFYISEIDDFTIEGVVTRSVRIFRSSNLLGSI